MNKSRSFALLLLAIAVLIIVSRIGVGFGFLAGISIPGVLVLVLLAYIFVDGIVHMNYGAIFIPASLIPFVLLRMDLIPNGRAYEIIDELTPAPLLVAGILVAIAFDILFGGSKRIEASASVVGESNESEWAKKHKKVESYVSDNGDVVIHNTFGETSKYIDAPNLTKSSISNSFGELNVYFNQTTIAEEGAIIKVSNSFGETNLHIPSSWRVTVYESCALGDIRKSGMPNSDASVPEVKLHLDNSLGQINVFYQ